MLPTITPLSMFPTLSNPSKTPSLVPPSSVAPTKATPEAVNGEGQMGTSMNLLVVKVAVPILVILLFAFGVFCYANHKYQWHSFAACRASWCSNNGKTHASASINGLSFSWAKGSGSGSSNNNNNSNNSSSSSSGGMRRSTSSSKLASQNTEAQNDLDEALIVSNSNSSNGDGSVINPLSTR